MRNRFLVLPALAAMCGCAFVMSGTSQEVSFTSDPPGATFTVGGQTATTPAKVVVPKEDYTIVFSKPGYRESTFELKRQVCGWFYGSLVMGVLASGFDVVTGAWKEFQSTDVAVTLEPDPETNEELPVKIISEPPGAEIRVGEALHGTAPRELKLLWKGKDAEKQVSLRLPRYRTLTIPLRRGQESLRATLEPEPLTVKVYVTSQPPGAEVKLAGRAVGRTPATVDVVWLPTDTPKGVEFAREGYHPVRLELQNEKQRELSAELSEVVLEVPLKLTLRPAGAELEVDGVIQATGSEVKLRWSESLRRHTIKVSHPGYVSKTQEVTREGASAPLEIRLTPLLPRVP